MSIKQIKTINKAEISFTGEGTVTEVRDLPPEPFAYPGWFVYVHGRSLMAVPVRSIKSVRLYHAEEK